MSDAPKSLATARVCSCISFPPKKGGSHFQALSLCCLVGNLLQAATYLDSHSLGHKLSEVVSRWYSQSSDQLLSPLLLKGCAGASLLRLLQSAVSCRGLLPEELLPSGDSEGCTKTWCFTDAALVILYAGVSTSDLFKGILVGGTVSGGHFTSTFSEGGRMERMLIFFF